MYSRKVIETVIRNWADKKAPNGERLNFTPTYYSIAEVEEFNQEIDTVLKDDGSGQNSYFVWRNGPPSDRDIRRIKRRIKNEKFLIFADAEYFITRYCKIRLVDERIVRMEFRIGQEIFLQCLAECDDQQIAMQFFLLKSRQVGISTCIALFFLHRILTRENTHAVMASASIPQSEKLNIIVNTAIDRLPFWIKPNRTSVRAKEPRWENGSTMSIQAGSQTVAISEGSTPTCIHLSEIGDYAEPIQTIEKGLFPAAHQSKSLFFAMEGTGDVASPWQQEKWWFYKNHWKKPGGRFRPIYIPPCCAPDIYPHKDWLRANPVPEGWYEKRMDETRRMEVRAKLFVRNTDYLCARFGARWEVPIEFVWYWEFMYIEALASNSVKTFMCQFAVTDKDAFQSKHDPVFKDEVIDVVTKERQAEYQAYAITGKTIRMGNDNEPYMPPAHEIDYSKERIEMLWEANDGNQYQWTLIPLVPFDDSKDENCFDKLMVYEDPVDGAKYCEGVDTAHGLGLAKEERACVAVYRNQYGKKRDVNAGSFTSNRVNSAQMARIAAAIATYFTTDWAGTITSSNPLGMRFIIEQVRKSGDECQHQLKLMGFHDHHTMHTYDDKNPDHNRGNKQGWRTVAWSRDFLLQRFINAVTSGWIKPNDPILIRQMATFVRKMPKNEGDSKPRLQHDAGHFDDNIFAHAMCWTTAHDVEDDAARLQSKYKAEVIETPASDSWCNSNSVTMD